MSLITNWCQRPKADVELQRWNAGAVTPNADGTFTYQKTDAFATLVPFKNITSAEYSQSTAVCAIRFKEITSNLEASGATVVRDGSKDGIWVYRGAFNTGQPFARPYFKLSLSALTPIALAIYTPENWERLQSLGLTLFDGDTMPRA